VAEQLDVYFNSAVTDFDAEMIAAAAREKGDLQKSRQP
jgi:hypothetical protein